MTIQERLFLLKDEEYKNFQAALVPNIEKEKIIGVRVPEIRKLAKEITDKNEIENFLKNLPHEFYEENILHGAFLEKIKDFDELLEKTKIFLPYVDNWAVCDMKLSKAFKKNPEKLLEQIKLWLKSEHTYTVRFAIGLLMRLFLDELFCKEYLNLVLSVKNDDYYVKMMVAWYFATALAKQWKATFPIIQQKKLEKWTHNKAIQKSLESFRITDEQKKLLRELKV